MKRLVILNPNSKFGKAAKQYYRMQPSLQERMGKLEVYLTRAPLDATDRVRAALKSDDFDQILVAGGDGSINECVNGYFENGKILSQKVPLAVINLGTGGDFFRSLKSHSPAYEEAIVENKFRLVDCGTVRQENREEAQYFINIASFGMGGEVVRNLKNSGFQKGTAAFFYHTLRTLLKFKAPAAKIRFKNETGAWQELEGEFLNFFVCNGQYNGGGMNWAPEGSIEDGVFDIVALADAGKSNLIVKSGKIYKGKIKEFPGASLYRGTEVIAEPLRPVSLEIDGEISKYDTDKRFQLHFQILPKTFPLVL